MPSTFLAPVQTPHRRVTGSARQRENRASQNSQGSASRRRKSRSPDARVLEEITVARNDSGSRKKKRPNLPTPVSAPGVLPSTPGGDPSIDRGRKFKAKPRAQSLFVEEGDTLVLREVARSATGSNRGKRKDRSKSREKALPPLPRKPISPELTESEADPPQSTYGGSELARMKQELENVRKQLAVSKKAVHKQSKVIDELRTELATTVKSQKDQAKETTKWKEQSKKSDELVANIETNLTCQICMDILSKPHGLSPCGHVLCQGCLQEWFRSAPPGEDEMVDDDYPESLLYRKKTCPCCRTAVRSRPIPLFLVKSLASTLEKAKAPPNAPRRVTPPPDDDPWVGIFHDPLHEMDDDWSEDGDEDDEEYDEDEDDDWSFDGYGTGEDEERYEGPHEHARWAPPMMHVTADDYPYLDELDAEDLAMLRRGVTLQMIDLFSMSYSHESGLQAVVDGVNTVYLGWNVYLHPDDSSGEEYMDWIVSDMYERPERWEVLEEMNGTWTAWKLVPEGEDEEYETEDSEAWTAGAADEDDDM